MRRPARLLAFALLTASCASPDIGYAPAAAEPPPADTGATVCKVGPDGGPVLGDRGIGGTGAASGAVQTAERGIGGTGATAGGMRSADRGIGGTGIIGVITGFASVCLDGREVALDDAVPVLVDGERASATALRAGQLAVVEAAGTSTALQARSVAVRHEVSGPVEAVAADGALRVAGQRVAISGETWGGVPRPGEWVAVSGLRRPDGVIAATRIDRRAPGGDLVTVHGPLVVGPDGTLRIGALEVQPAMGIPVAAPGQFVTAFGHYRDGSVLLAESVTPDVLAEDPVAYFGRSVGVVVVEAYASVGGGRLRLGRRLDAVPPPGLGPFTARRAVVEFERRGDGALVATAVREGSARLGRQEGMSGQPGSAPQPGPGGGAPAPGRGASGPGGGPGGQAAPAPVPSPRVFEPAPVPNRSFGPDRTGVGGPLSGPGRSGPPRGGNRFNAGSPGAAGQPGFGPGPSGPVGGLGGPGGGGGRGH